MRQSFLLVLFFSSFQSFVFSQRTTRKAQSTSTVYQLPSFVGRYFTVTLINSDTVPFLLKVGPYKQIRNGDTLNLARTYPCNSPSVGEYYDLHDLVDEENNCIRWYGLQQVKPKDTLHFVVKLKDFDKSEMSRVYYCFTKEIKKADKELNMYADDKTFYMMKESRDFETSFIAIDKNALNTGFAKVGLNIYISSLNQQ